VSIRTPVIIVSWMACIACNSSGAEKRPLPDRGMAAGAAADDDAALNQPDGGGLEAGAAPIECEARVPLECPNPSPHWGDVYPIFMRRCVSCHTAKGGQWPLSQYEHVADWSGEIRAQLLACTMPPVDAGIDMPLAERQKILSWIRCGVLK
jgi:hypothetical protein